MFEPNTILEAQTEPTVESMARTIDEVMPLAQCLGALRAYLKRGPTGKGLAYDKERSFVLVRLINA